MSQFETKFSTQSESRFETSFDSSSDVYEKILDSLKTPYIGENGNWYEWNVESQSFVDTGVSAYGTKGDKGDKGDKGADGVNGEKGADGYTPIKGTDYFTQSDKDELVNDVLSSLPTWTGGAY